MVKRMTDKDLNEIVAQHSSQIESIGAMLGRISQDVQILSDRIISSTKTPTSTILSVMSIIIVISFAFGGYLRREFNRQGAEIATLRESQLEATFEAGKHDDVIDDLHTLRDRQRLHDIDSAADNARQSERLRGVEMLIVGHQSVDNKEFRIGEPDAHQDAH